MNEVLKGPGERRAQRRAAIVATPVCGLAVATPAYARRALAVLAELGRMLIDFD